MYTSLGLKCFSFFKTCVYPPGWLQWKRLKIPSVGKDVRYLGYSHTTMKVCINWYNHFRILRPPDVKSWLIWKDPDAGKDRRQEEKGMTENEMLGWHHRLNGHEFEQAPGDGEGQGGLVCCSPWGPKELDMTEWWTTTLENWRPLPKLIICTARDPANSLLGHPCILSR